MNLFFRIILAIYASCLTIVSALAMVFTLKPRLLSETAGFLAEKIQTNSNTAILLFFVEIVFLVLSVIFLLSGLKNDREKKAITQLTNIGEVRISLNAIETIVLNSARKISGIKEAKAIVTKHGDGVWVNVRSTVLSDVNIPVLLQDVQVKVKKTVEDMTGIKVNQVNAQVENVYAGYKNRVE